MFAMLTLILANNYMMLSWGGKRGFVFVSADRVLFHRNSASTAANKAFM